MGKASVGFPAAAREVPTGFIGLWSGTVNAVPKGWALCNGQNGTPDLRDRFVVGASGIYGVGAKGGSETVTLTTSEMPSHNHAAYASSSAHSRGGGLGSSSTTSVVTSVSGGGVGVVNRTNAITSVSSGTTGGASDSTYVTIESSGNSKPHNNMPPYYALCYIMKL